MTAKINKSAIDAIPQFDLIVAEHAEKLRHWRDHMAKVDEQKGNDRIPLIERYQPFDRPRASDLIESAINEKFDVDYESIDDSLAVLELKKRELIGRVQQLEAAAILAIVPAGKQRLMAMRESQVREDDNDRGKLLMEQAEKPGFLKRMFGDGKIDLAAAIEEQRPPADTAFLAELKEVRRRIRDIGFIAAQAMHDIEDLTVDTVAQWKDPDFSGV